MTQEVSRLAESPDFMKATGLEKILVGVLKLPEGEMFPQVYERCQLSALC